MRNHFMRMHVRGSSEMLGLAAPHPCLSFVYLPHTTGTRRKPRSFRRAALATPIQQQEGIDFDQSVFGCSIDVVLA